LSARARKADPRRPARVELPAGLFMMGSDDHYAEEAPVHAVMVDSFAIDLHPVTNRDFAEFVEDTGWTTFAEIPPDPKDYPGAPPEMLQPASLVFTPPPGPVPLHDIRAWWHYLNGANWRNPRGPGTTLDGLWDHPVVHVAWADVAAYARWAGAEIPTEAEWEYACRAGSETAYCFGDSEELLGEYAWYHANSKGSSQIVGTKTPNNWGLHDMHGNVWEWCADVYDAKYYRRFAGRTAVDPVGPAGGVGSQRVLRGGSWGSNAVYCRSADRSRFSPDYRYYYLGFRLALSSVK